MSEFRPAISPATAPSGPPRPGWPTLAAAATFAALLAGLLWPEPRATRGAGDDRPASARAERGSAWDSAIVALTGERAAAPAAPRDLPGQAPLAALTLAPHVVDGEIAGYVIAPGELPPTLTEAGLRAGDLLTTIDGLPLDAARARRLADEFGGLDDLEVTYQRSGELRDTLIVFRER